MTISIQFVKIQTSETLHDYITRKLNKLGKKYPWVINVDVFIKLDSIPSGKGKICEIELSAPGPRIFAVSKEKNFEMAVKETISDIEKQLQKQKTIFTAH